MLGRRVLPEAERLLVELATVHHHVLEMVKLQNSKKRAFRCGGNHILKY